MLNKGFVTPPVHLAVVLARIFSTSGSLRNPVSYRGTGKLAPDEIAAMKRRPR
jgi:hypothetical protein